MGESEQAEAFTCHESTGREEGGITSVKEGGMKEKYNALCSSTDCYRMVKEDDIERDNDGNIFERSKICWDCRTKQDRVAIKRWRQKHNKS